MFFYFKFCTLFLVLVFSSCNYTTNKTKDTSVEITIDTTNNIELKEVSSHHKDSSINITTSRNINSGEEYSYRYFFINKKEGHLKFSKQIVRTWQLDSITNSEYQYKGTYFSGDFFVDSAGLNKELFFAVELIATKYLSYTESKKIMLVIMDEFNNLLTTQDEFITKSDSSSSLGSYSFSLKKEKKSSDKYKENIKWENKSTFSIDYFFYNMDSIEVLLKAHWSYTKNGNDFKPHFYK
jgi:hypothetical protein